MYFQGVETERFQRGVKLIRSTFTALTVGLRELQALLCHLDVDLVCCALQLHPLLALKL